MRKVNKPRKQSLSLRDKRSLSLRDKQSLSLRDKRRRRIRAKIFGNKDRPRLSVFRSNRYIYAQLIDDERGRTLVSVSEREFGDVRPGGSEVKSEKKRARKGSGSDDRKSLVFSKIDRAKLVGELLAKKAKENGFEKVTFDRGGYKYHGRVKAFAEAVRKGGLEF